jgi:hypothetical protein
MPSIETADTFDRTNADSHFDALPLEAKHLIEMAVIRPFDDFDAGAQARHNKGQELHREAEDAERSHMVALRSLETNPIQSDADREYAARLERKAKAARKRHADYMAKGGKAFEGMKPDAVFARIANRTFAKPHKLRAVTVPKGATLESVRKRMTEAAAEIAEVMKRPKPMKEAREVLMAALERDLKKNKSFGGIFESIFVRYRNGDPTQPYESTDMQLKLDNIARAGIRGHMMAALDEKLKSAYETRFDFENPIGRKERAKLIAKLQAEIEDLEWVEGALIRTAVERGERVLLRPDTRNLSAVLNLEIDTDEIARREAAAKAAKAA